MRKFLYRKDQAEDNGAVMEVKDYPPYLDYPKSRRPQTKGDRIRAMSDEELAVLLCGFVSGDCYDCIAYEMCDICGGEANGLIKWIKQEV